MQAEDRPRGKDNAASAGARESLPAPFAGPFSRWLRDLEERHGALSLTELRKGVRALSSLYVERRRTGSSGAFAGAAKRAAFASYFAPLHFLQAQRAAAQLRPAVAIRRVIDLGAGSGAAGVAAATCLGARQVLAVDQSGWALGEARRTCAAFGLVCRTRRSRLPTGLPRVERGDALVCGWFLNECDAPTRDALLDFLARAARDALPVLVLEPLATRIVPWWEQAERALTRVGLRAEELRIPIERPEWIARLDQASGLDHRELGARVLYGPHL